ncbi:MAG: SRPBCC family protein, partial [Actinomycetes bacterium]|nr:SRPBCC family protein [Actinomycetes bacterium]
MIPAPPGVAFARYADILSWTRWAGLGRVALGRPGDVDGVGALRVIANGPVRVVEEVTAVDAPRRLDYRLVRGFPIRDHAGWVTFTPSDGGTTVLWECDFTSRIPGAGPAFRVLFAAIF